MSKLRGAAEAVIAAEEALLAHGSDHSGQSRSGGRSEAIGFDFVALRSERFRTQRTVGERNIIAALSHGVEGMRVGGRRRLRVGPHIAYRGQGVPGVVPPNAKLTFDVELIAVES